MKSWLKKFKEKPRLLFKTSAPPELHTYVGRMVLIDGKPVKIESIVGNRITPTFYEINGEHLIGMLRFHAQMMGVNDITEDEFKAFEEMELRADRRVKPKPKTALEVPKLPPLEGVEDEPIKH
jgi:hypothetical protein